MNAREVALKKLLRIHLFTDDSEQNKRASNKTEKSFSLVQNSKADDGCYEKKAGSTRRQTNNRRVAAKISHYRGPWMGRISNNLFTDDSEQNKRACNKTEKFFSLVQNSKADDGCYEKKKAGSMGRRTNDRGVAAKVSHYGGPWMGRRSSIVGFIKARPFKVKRDSYCCSRY